MFKRLSSYLLFVVLWTTFSGSPCAQQQSGFLDAEKTKAYQLFHKGKVRQAITAIQALIQTASAQDKPYLQRDLLEACATGYDWDCVQRTIGELVPLLNSDEKLRPIYPYIVLYELKLMRWFNNHAYISQFLQRGGPSSVANILSYPSVLAEMHLVLADYQISRNDMQAAEVSISSAMFGLLLTNSSQKFDIAKIIVSLIDTLVLKQDILGARELYELTKEFITNSLPHGGVLYAHYRMTTANLFSFWNANSSTALIYAEASTLMRSLEINQDVKEYQIASASDMETAALVLDNKLAEAQNAFASNPSKAQREALLARGEFHSYGEFYFALTEVFIDSFSKKKADIRWKSLFEKERKWNLSEIEQSEFDSYANFALGLLSIGTKNIADAQRLILLAASERINTFEKVFRLNFEGIPAPRLVDKIIIMAGLEAAVKAGDPDSLNLMLRGGEILGRGQRDHMVDLGSLLASQRETKWRRNIHSYVHLVDDKRRWELERIRRLLANDPAVAEKGKLISEYTQAVSEIGRLKDHIKSDPGFKTDRGLPSIDQIQQTLKDKQAFIRYFPFLGGIGKLCVNRDQATYAVATPRSSAEYMDHIGKLSAAVSEPPSLVNPADRFPVPSAVYLNELLFGGLEKCLASGTAVTIALPQELAGVPLGALLKSEPARQGDGYDLRDAQWLIRDLSFSVVISARHYLATIESAEREVAPRAFLGVGDPKPDAAKLASSDAFQRSIKTRNGVLDFQELPETADELRAAGELFGAPPSDILLGKLGTEEALRAKPLGDYDVLHFATHGLLKDDLEGLPDSALLLTPGSGQDKFDDGLLHASEIARLSLNARLVVLSACNTAKYDIAHASRGVQDLQAAFTIAGAPTLLGSLWPVDSAVARDMMIGFFKEWRSAKSRGASDALAKATRDFLHRSDAIHQHPWFWAPYVIDGNGAIPGYSVTRRSSDPPAYAVFEGFGGGAEIVHAARFGSDMLYAMIAEWDGKKMNGILSRRSASGVEKWRVGSREVGIERVASDGKVIYSVGYTTEKNTVPVFRSFDASGRLRWQKQFDEYGGYGFSDLIIAPEGIFTVGFPRLVPTPSNDRAIILALDADGKIKLKSEIKIEPRKPTLGAEALIVTWGDKLVVTANNGSTVLAQPDFLFGIKLPCHSGASTSIYQLDKRTLETVATQSIPNFRAVSLLASEQDLYIGGEALNTCSFKGSASILHLKGSDRPEKFWQDDEIFNSSVRGMVRDGKGFLAAINQERSLGVEMPTFAGLDYSKRWTEEVSGRREGALTAFSKNGTITSRQFLSAGMGTYVQGVVVSRDGPMIYGVLGGMPWTAQFHAPRLHPAINGKSGEPARKPTRAWWRLW